MRFKTLAATAFATLLCTSPVMAEDSEDTHPSTLADIGKIERIIKSYFVEFPEIAKTIHVAKTAVTQGQCTTSESTFDWALGSVTVSMTCTLSPRREVLIEAEQFGTPKGKPTPVDHGKEGGPATVYFVSFRDTWNGSHQSVITFTLYDGPPKKDDD